jgi:sulfate adenylyltransferase subunit 2
MSALSIAKSGLSHLDWLEAEAIHIMREVAGQCSNPALLFSGGKDSICLLRLAEKAFRPGKFPFPLVHIDTGHNYPEVLAFRDKRATELGERLIVRSVEDSMERGTVVLKNATESRNKHQSVTRLPSSSSMPALAAPAAMKKRLVQRNAYFPFATNSGSGTPKANVPSYGECTTRESIRAKTFVLFPFQIGLSSMYGNTSLEKSWNSHPSTLHTTGKLCAEAAPLCP